MHTIAQYESSLAPVPLLHPQEATLSEAFSSFVNAANVLERSYGDLQEEVGRLRLELQESHCDLERSLRENELIRNWLSGIVESLPCGVIVLDENGRPKLRNQEAIKLLSDGNPKTLKIFSEAARQKIGREYEYELAGPQLAGSQTQRAFSIKRAQLAASANATRESVVIVREITEQRQMEKEREANRRMQSLAEISAMLAHEIRNPLASMELFASLLGDTIAHDTEEMEWVQQIRAGLRLLSATVNNVLQFYSQAQVALFPVQLSDLLKTTISFLTPIAQQHEIGIVFDSQANNGTIDGDTHKLQQVFFNLAVNAFRAMQPGRRLTIALEQPDESHVRVEFPMGRTGTLSTRASRYPWRR